MAITKILNIREAKGRNPATHLETALNYIQNPDKTEKCVLVGSINCLPDTAFQQMVETKELYQKTDKRQGYHVIISFSPEEKVTAEQAMYVLEHFAKDVLGDNYEAVYAVHTDRDHMHGHLIWNSVSITTGEKYNSPKGNWKNHLQPVTNKYCRKLGLEIMPAEYSKNPKNLSRDLWEKEMEYKEIILRDAKMCAYAAGDVEHFKYLMRSLGYIFKAGVWMEVQAPGCRYYHKLKRLDEMFAEDKLKYYVDFPYTVQAYFYSKDIRKIRHSNMSAFQERYYAKMYRLRIVEQKRFSVKGVKFTEELKRFYQLQDEYLMLVNHDIRSITDLLNYRSSKEEKIQQIENRQQELYRLNSSKKRRIKTEEHLREYQQWHLGVQNELDNLKQQKKDAKYQLKLADATLNEKLDMAMLEVSEAEPLVSNDEIVIPIPVVEADEQEMVRGKVTEDTEIDTETDIEVSEIDDNFVSKEFDECFRNESVDIISDEKNDMVRKIVEETDKKEALEIDSTQYLNEDVNSITGSPETVYGKRNVESVGVNIGEYEEIRLNELSVASPISLQEYSLQEKITILGLQMSDTMTSIFEKVKQYFENNGFDVSFDELYEEAKLLTKAAQKDAIADRVEKVVRELELYGSYPYLKTFVKANAFKFDVSDASGNLELFIKVMDKLGVKLENDALYEEYQKIYDETVSRSVEKDKGQEKMWNRGRGR